MADPSAPARRSQEAAERTALVAVPLLMFALDAASKLARGAPTEFLLVPPLAVVAWLLFSDPDRADGRLRAVVLLPLAGAVAGEAGFAALGAEPWTIALVVLAVLLAQRALRARMPPALAIAVLAILLRVRGPWYALDVAASSLVLWAAFHAWRRARAWRPAGPGRTAPGGPRRPARSA